MSDTTEVIDQISVVPSIFKTRTKCRVYYLHVLSIFLILILLISILIIIIHVASEVEPLLSKFHLILDDLRDTIDDLKKMRELMDDLKELLTKQQNIPFRL